MPGTQQSGQVINALRHQRLVHLSLTSLIAWYSCDQRLTASKVSTQQTFSHQNQSPALVINALRHQRLVHPLPYRKNASQQTCDQRLTASKVSTLIMATAFNWPSASDQRLTASKVSTRFSIAKFCARNSCDQRLTASKVSTRRGWKGLWCIASQSILQAPLEKRQEISSSELVSDSTKAENRYSVRLSENASSNCSLSNPEIETALAIQINFSP